MQKARMSDECLLYKKKNKWVSRRVRVSRSVKWTCEEWNAVGSRKKEKEKKLSCSWVRDKQGSLTHTASVGILKSFILLRHSVYKVCGNIEHTVSVLSWRVQTNSSIHCHSYVMNKWSAAAFLKCLKPGVGVIHNGCCTLVQKWAISIGGNCIKVLHGVTF